MAVRTESYRGLYHGTDAESAKKICANGFIPSKARNSWCGEGVYFYDIKSKAWWSAKRTCEAILANDGKRVASQIVSADVLNVPRQEILDLRAIEDLKAFEESMNDLFDNYLLQCDGIDDEEERKIALRSLLISFYAKKYCKSVVVGIFQQRRRDDYQPTIQFATGLYLVAGVETIYCVKNTSYIQNIRIGGA